MSIKEKTTSILSLAGIDNATFWALSLKIWLMGSGLITTILVAKFLTQEEQGYYYTFLSIITIQVFIEFGLGIVISSYASHEWAHLNLDARGIIFGKKESLNRLVSLGVFSKRWYLKISIISFLILLFGGSFFFSMKGLDNIDIWLMPWLFFSLLTVMTIYLIPFLSILEGCNQVKNIYMFKLAQAIIAGLVAWLALYLGLGLWTSALAGFSGLFLIVILIFTKYKNFFSIVFYSNHCQSRINWKNDILPMQWRIGVSWIGGYLTISLLVPTVFYFHGSIVAGQLGMTLVVTSAITSIITAWITPKAPIFGVLIAQSKFDELNKMFYGLFLRVATLAVSIAIILWSAIYLVNYYQLTLAERLLPPLTSFYFLCGTAILCIGLPLSTYMRAHKKEPLLLLSILCGISTSIAIYISAKYFSINVLAFMYFLNILIFTPFIFIIWIRFRKKYHFKL